jgi:hypothetical protein
MSLCDVAQPVSEFEIFIPLLLSGDTVLINFKTYKCCSDDDTLLNVQKYFNHWRISNTAYNECNNPVVFDPGNPIDSIYPVLAQNAPGISPHASYSVSDLNLSLSYNPQVVSLVAPPYPPGIPYSFGDFGDFKVKLNGLIRQEDIQILGVSGTDSTMKGFPACYDKMRYRFTSEGTGN